MSLKVTDLRKSASYHKINTVMQNKTEGLINYKDLSFEICNQTDSTNNLLMRILGLFSHFANLCNIEIVHATNKTRQIS